jgi:hypothetical protein
MLTHWLTVPRSSKQGSRRPWKLHQNYLLDLLALKFSAIDDGVLRFGVASGSGRALSSGVPAIGRYQNPGSNQQNQKADDRPLDVAGHEAAC